MQRISDKTKDVVVDGGLHVLSPSTRTAIEYLCHVMAKDHSLRNGKTALFWHLVGEVALHIEDDAKK
jgi:hypothetical protein